MSNSCGQSIQNLIDNEQKGLSFVRQGEHALAIPFFEEVVKLCPTWEHGSAAYSLAFCYEDLGRLEDAEKHYLLALECEGENSHYLGGYASFLYLHGSPSGSLEFYLKLIKSERCRKSVIADCMPALKDLAQKHGLSENDLVRMITATCPDVQAESII